MTRANGALARQAFKRVEAGKTRHFHIEEHQIRHFMVQGLQQGFAGFECDDTMVPSGKTFDERRRGSPAHRR